MTLLLPCPFCGGAAEFEREGTPRQSCIVVCSDCGARHESSDQDAHSGSSWNRRPAVDLAINLAVRFGGIDGNHHKAWVIDQMVRALAGCGTDWNGDSRPTEPTPPNDEYLFIVASAREGEDGPQTYDWDEGISP